MYFKTLNLTCEFCSHVLSFRFFRFEAILNELKKLGQEKFETKMLLPDFNQMRKTFKDFKDERERERERVMECKMRLMK